jgi:hypothetical protein
LRPARLTCLVIAAMFRTGMALDWTNRTLTAVVGGIVVAVVVVVLATRAGMAVAVFACGPVLLALAVAWAMSPREVVVNGGELCVVRRAWPPVRVPLAAITEVSTVPGVGVWAIRLFGVGGFFGSYGLFSSAALGRFRLYATRRGPAVMIRRKDDKLPIVITPDDVPGTIEALKR